MPTANKPLLAYPWADVHVFVSSTFNGMHGERDYLVKEVFPELRDWCEERKLRLVDIDLRWGVSEADATHNKRVVDVCLRNIDRCRPFFLCFLGQRYGWVPGKDDVLAETLARFPGLADAVADQRSVTEMEIQHAVVAPFAEGKDRKAAEHAFFYERGRGYLDEMPSEPVQLRRAYSDEAEEDPASRAFLVGRQNDLRAAVGKQTQRPVRAYKARWQSEQRTPELAMATACPASLPENQTRWRRDWLRYAGVSIFEGALEVPAGQRARANAHNERLCAGRLGDFWAEGRSLGDVIVADLKAVILERYPDRADLSVQDDLSREIDRYEDFIRTATEVFIEREGDFTALDAYASGDSRNLFSLVARAGLGKSTLLANWVARWHSREDRPEGESLHVRFVGVGERSNSVDSLLRSILEELRRSGKLASEIPDNANLLRSKFAELLGEAGKQGRVVVVIDALNQLQSGLSDLDWVTRTLPENVKLIVSFKLGDEAGDALAAQLRGDSRVTVAEVAPFTSIGDREALVAAYLKQYLKELDQQHLHALVRAEGAENPLFLKVVLTELRVFGAFAQLGEVIKSTFGTTPQNAFEAVLHRLETDPSTSAIPPSQAVPLLFGLLAHSRGGLPENLAVRMFLDDLGFDETRTESIRATIRLLLRQVRPFLAKRDGRTDFFYEAFRLAARRRYVGEGDGKRAEAGWNRVLARVCEKWSGLTGVSQRYALGNLVQHQVAAGNAAEAAEVMTDFVYHHQRLKVLGREDVVNVTADFAVMDGTAEMVPAVHERFGVWKAFHAENAHFLRREVIGLAPETYLLQLAVAHADASPVTRSAERWLETAGSQTQWVRSLKRPHEVERRACLLTLEGHTSYVEAIAVLPDGKRALSGSIPELIFQHQTATLFISSKTAVRPLCDLYAHRRAAMASAPS